MHPSFFGNSFLGPFIALFLLCSSFSEAVIFADIAGYSLLLCLQTSSRWVVSIQSPEPEPPWKGSNGTVFAPLWGPGQGSTITGQSMWIKWIQGWCACVVIRSISLRSHHSNIICIDNTCHVSRKRVVNMHNTLKMVKVNIFCWAHFLNWFSVYKGHTHAQYHA